MVTEAAVKRPRGRPKLSDGEKRIKKSISLYPKVIRFARYLGQGQASNGIELAVRAHSQLSVKEAQAGLERRPEGLIDHAVEKTSVSLCPETLEYLLVTGDGSLSSGVATVLHTLMGASGWNG